VERQEQGLLQPIAQQLQGLHVSAEHTEVPAALTDSKKQAKAVAGRKAALQRLKALIAALEESITFSFRVHQFTGGVDPQSALIVKHMLEVQWQRCRGLGHHLALVVLQEQGGRTGGRGSSSTAVAGQHTAQEDG
jgi:hypothetical protein